MNKQNQRYNPVDKTKTPTQIFIEEYSITRGLIMRSHSSSKLVAYCVENPEEVLARVFPDYLVTSFQGYEFFSPENTHGSAPLAGIGIRGTDQFSGIQGININGKVAKILKLEELAELKRSEPVSAEQVNDILKYVTKEDNMIRISPNYPQWKYETGQISRVLKKCLK